MKKLFALVLVLVTVFTLAACGESAASASKPTNPAPTTTPNPNPTQAPTVQNPTTQAPIVTLPPETTAPQPEEPVGVLGKEAESQFCMLAECEMSDRFAKYYSNYMIYVNALGNLALVDLREEKTDLSVTLTPAVKEVDGEEVQGYDVKIFAGQAWIRTFFWDAVRGYVVVIYANDDVLPQCNEDPETNLVDEYIKK